MNRKKFIQYVVAFGGLSLLILLIVRRFSFRNRIDLDELLIKKQLIEELVETIIPRTDTPGAKDAGVADFVIDIVRDCTVPKEQQTFINGLHKLEMYTIQKYKQPFKACGTKDRIAILTYFERHATYRIDVLNKLKRRFFGDSFIEKLKHLTVEGYCTSLLGATQGLAYDFTPMTYEPCIPLTPGQRTWAMR